VELSGVQFSSPGQSIYLHLTAHPRANCARKKIVPQKRLSPSPPAPGKLAILNAQTRERKVRDRTLLNLAHGGALHLQLYFLGVSEAVYNAQASNVFYGHIEYWFS
jgi:hypothetical protein